MEKGMTAGIDGGTSLPLTEARDLRTGKVPWREKDWLPPASGELPSHHVDIAILGGGIMGSILAERLSAAGRTVAICDRRAPGTGSTAASTAQLMWAMDVPLATLADRLGEQEAARRWKRVFAALERFGRHLDTIDGDLKQDSLPSISPVTCLDPKRSPPKPRFIASTDCPPVFSQPRR